MEVSSHARFEVLDATSAGAIRREASDLAHKLGFSEEDVGRVAIVASEAASNTWKHAGGGEVLLGIHRRGEVRAVEIVALDRGVGMADVAASLRDGVSTTGTAGNGLGAIQRQATTTDLYTLPGRGTALVARIGALDRSAAGPAVAEFGAICVPIAHETVSGDAWTCVPGDGGLWRIVVADGLGHGELAAQASSAAVRAFLERPLGPADALHHIHGVLRPTRGAAVTVLEIDLGRERLRSAGIGNVSASVHADGRSRSLVSHHGTAGHDARRIQEFEAPFGRGSLLIVHSDGLATQWALDRYPGLAARHPLMIAGVLYRDFRRERDDVTVLAFRGPA